MSRNKKKYLKFLMDIVDTSEDDYGMLFNKLLDIPFVYFVGNDDNRAVDGLNLRFEYEEEYGKVHELDEDECSLLEMFIALARRCDVDMMYDEDYGNRVPHWFWLMMDNIGLSDFDNFNYDEDLIEKLCDKFNYRKYTKEGKNGGAFPISRPKEDLRDVELWFQMSWYMIKNEKI